MQMSEFTKYINEARAKGDLATARRIKMERAICSALVKAALERGLVCSVYDGGAWPVKKSAKYSEIMNALFTTDSDVLQLRNAEGVSMGRFDLIYGNDGYDVVADYTVTETTESLWQEVINPLSEKLERQG
jgi:hypothetical protein